MSLSKIKMVGLLIMTISLFSGCQPSKATDPLPPYKTFKIFSQSVEEERVICVWTPPGYAETTVSYPVLYMPDGGIKEDFPHIANTISALVKSGEIAPLILVGIENTQRRRDLTGPSEVAEDAEIAPLGDGASKFRAFIKEELFAEVEKRFRVTGQRAIVGESAAGLFIVETFFLQPEMFETYLAIDPSIYWNNHFLVRTAEGRLQNFSKKPLKLWFASSKEDIISTYTGQLEEILKKSAPENLHWNYSPKPEEKHSTIFRASKEEAFKWGLWK